MQRDARAHLTHRAESENRHTATLRDIGIRYRLPGGRQHVREVHEALIGRILWHLYRHILRLRDAQVLCLPARHLSVELGEPEQLRSQSLPAYLQGFALRLEAPIAHPAVPTADSEGYHYAVSGLYVRDVLADLFDYAHGLVSKDVTLTHEHSEHLVKL